MRFQPKKLGNESSDRRARVRRTPSALAYLDAGEGNGGIVLNISESGVAIAVAHGMTAERIPSLTFRLPQLDRTFLAAGEIVWRSESTKSVGLRFLDLTDQDRGQIRNWICAEIVSAEMEATHEAVREGASANPVLVMPSPRKAGPGVPFDTVPDEERAAAFERMFPSEASLKAAPAKNQLELTLMPDVMPAVTSDIASEITAVRREEVAAETKIASDNVADALTAAPFEETVEETVANVAEFEAADVVPSTQTEEPASQTTPDLDWRDQWERFHAEREEIARAPHLDIGLYVPIAPGIAEPAASPGIPGMVAADPEPVSTSASASGASDSVRSDAVAGTVAALAAMTPAAMTPDATAPTFVPATPPRATVTLAGTTRRAPGNDENRKSGTSAGLPAFLGSSPASSARLKIPAVVAVAVKTAPRRSSAGNTLSIATLGLVLVLLCFALGYVIQPGAFHFSAWRTGSAEPGAAQTNPDGASTATPTITPTASNASDPAPDTSTGDLAQTEKQSSVLATPPKDTMPVSAHPQVSPPAITPEKARDAEAKINSATSATDMRATAPPSPAVPSPDIVAPSPVSFFPVTAPSAGSPPKLVQLPEEIVADTPAILIRSREFLFVPAAPGAESTHPLGRVHVGDRIAKAIPNYPAAGAEKVADAGGTVHLRSTIGTDGTISAVQTISGPANLIALAEAAVRQWRYRPSDIDGKPIAVDEDVTIDFRPVR